MPMAVRATGGVDTLGINCPVFGLLKKVMRSEVERSSPARYTDRKIELERVIRHKVAPELAALHNVDRANARPARIKHYHFTQKDIDRFQRLVAFPDIALCKEFALSLGRNGVPLRSILLGLIAPTAKQLGARWDNDELNFFDVSLGAMRLGVLTEVLGRSTPTRPCESGTKRILLVGNRSDSHSLGMRMVEALFHSDGWLVNHQMLDQTKEQSTEKLSDTWFKAVGLCASTYRATLDLRPLIETIRQGSLNRDIFIIVGGAAFCSSPKLAEDIGADAFASDAGLALDIANAF